LRPLTPRQGFVNDWLTSRKRSFNAHSLAEIRSFLNSLSASLTTC
jgi:hypothetical protein